MPLFKYPPAAHPGRKNLAMRLKSPGEARPAHQSDKSLPPLGEPALGDALPRKEQSLELPINELFPPFCRGLN